VQQQRDVAAHRVAQHFTSRRDRGRDLRVVVDAETAQVLGDDGVMLLRHYHLEPEVGEALGEQTLRRADEEDRLFQEALAPNKSRFLA